MSETGTFSALIDEAMKRSNRRDRINDIVSYARNTLRECRVLEVFDQDLYEDSLTVDAVPFIWKRPANLRTILAAKPDVVTRRGEQFWFVNKKPGSEIVAEEFFMYLSGNNFTFSGELLTDQSTIGIAYFTYGRKFIYYPVGERPAVYDPETETWAYLEQYNTDDIARDFARSLVSDWLVFEWYDLILEGTLAKIFKTVGDERSRSSFALYKQQQQDLIHGESSTYLKADIDPYER